MDLKTIAMYFIVKKLDRMGKLGGDQEGQHTEERNLAKGIPDYLTKTNKGQKAIEKAKKDLVNKGWLMKRKKTGEWHYWLFHQKINEILDFKTKMEIWEKTEKNFL